MDSPRSVLPGDLLTAEIIGQRAAAQQIAMHSMDCCGRFVWPWPADGRPAFYWYAVEAVHSDFDDLPPALLVSEGFARTEAGARAAACRALCEPRPPLHVRALRKAAPAHARPASPRARVLTALMLVAVLAAVVGAALFLAGVAGRSPDLRGQGITLVAVGLAGRLVLSWWAGGDR